MKGDFNGDGELDVAVGAPCWSEGERIDLGRVYVFIGPNIKSVFSKIITIEGKMPGKQFGSSLLVKVENFYYIKVVHIFCFHIIMKFRNKNLILFVYYFLIVFDLT